MSLLAGQIAGIIEFAAFLPYVVGIIRRTTIPNRATWIIWTVMSTISFITYRASGAGNTIWYPLGDAIGPFLVCLLCINYGERGWSLRDRACLFIAATSLFLWWLSGTPLVGLCMNLIADAMGAIPTIHKVYLRPESESRLSWTMGFIAASINLMAIENWHSVAIVSYPLYMFGIMSILIALHWIRPVLKKVQLPLKFP